MMQRQFTHIEVGNAEFTPTGEELKDIAKRFAEDETFADSHFTIHSSYLPNTKFKIVICAGDAEWSPTSHELYDLKSLVDLKFLEKNPVVVTRNSVCFTIFELLDNVEE